jgi:hypothetical protein
VESLSVVIVGWKEWDCRVIEITNDTAPVGWEAALRFYDLMHQQAQWQDYKGEDKLIYRGSVTTIFNSLGVSQSNYSEIVTLLFRMGCLIYLEKGAGKRVSIVEVVKRPELQDWLSKRMFWLGRGKDLTRRSAVAKLEQRLNEVVNHQLGGMNIAEALADIEQRLSSIEMQVQELNGAKESNGTAQK